MLVYPQLGSGTLSQFPIRKQRKARTVWFRSADGRRIQLSDQPAEITEWDLAYVDLMDEEIQKLKDFFRTCEGMARTFTFADPLENLLAWSEHLDEAVWTRGPQLSVVGGIDDYRGRLRASRLANAGAGPQSITQTLEAPAEYVYCFSVWVRAEIPSPLTMLVCGQRAERSADVQWRRIAQAATGEPTFGLEILAGAVVEVFGFQAEAQPAPSGYKEGSIGGVYQDVRLCNDFLRVKTTGPGLHSCRVKILHAHHI